MRQSIWRLPWITCLVERANDYPCSKNVIQRWSYRRKIDPFFGICRKKSSEIGYFLLIVSWRSFPLKFPVKTADFSTNLPLKILRNLTLAKKSSLDCSQSSIFSVRLFTVPYFFVRYTASYRHWYLDFVRYTATYRHRYLDFQMPVTQSARFRWSYGRIEDCEQSNFDFFAAKSADFSANLDFFSRQNPAKSADFSANFPLKIPRNFAFFPRNIRSPELKGISKLVVW